MPKIDLVLGDDSASIRFPGFLPDNRQVFRRLDHQDMIIGTFHDGQLVEIYLARVSSHFTDGVLTEEPDVIDWLEQYAPYELEGKSLSFADLLQHAMGLYERPASD